MILPKVNDNYFQERSGVLAFSQIVNEIRCIWRETPNADVGIDGQVEFVNAEGMSTGQIVAVQVKSGPSYLKNGENDVIVYYPSERHATYWRDFPIPVILVIYDPANKMAHWVDARHQLRAYAGGGAGIQVPRSSVITPANRAEIFQTSGPVGGRTLLPDEVIVSLAQNRSEAKGFQVSFFQLFGLGIVDIGRKLFFSMGFCTDVVSAHSSHDGLGIGAPEFAFIDRYIHFLVAQNLIYYDFSDYLIDRDVRQVVPLFICPLTERGQKVLAIMTQLANGQGTNPFYEASVEFDERFRFSLPERLSQILAVEDEVRKAGRSPEELKG
jgi:hypothetical protein